MALESFSVPSQMALIIDVAAKILADNLASLLRLPLDALLLGCRTEGLDLGAASPMTQGGKSDD